MIVRIVTALSKNNVLGDEDSYKSRYPVRDQGDEVLETLEEFRRGLDRYRDRVHKNQRVRIFFLEAIEGGRNRPRRGAS